MNYKHILQLKGISKKFKKATAIDNIDLHIRKNTIYCLLGPNGAGKSTTLKIITGLLRPSSGFIEFNGHPWTRKDLNYTGSLIENAPLYGNLTSKENLDVLTTMLGIPKTRIDEVLEIVGLQDTGSKQVKNFSMGMKQRLGIAQAILNNPDLLILDEPTNGLDPLAIQELRELILNFPKNGVTVLLSSHMLSEVEHLADYIGIISNGTLVYEGAYNNVDDLEKLFTEVVKENKLN
ncbi:lantibiotic protection ABC transporter ATP-binding protein [Romboutsia sedimentorum]|uniref:Lantibiotic protection ABC transporter ATP-binding protein n=1 Tax=Romboutsia sedimentorum TaxID=1368474 RepID=A0ABT7EBE3_9FIRM|nr:lantibiotic protection ABC transporter ATP-binding protein [Romboutsia sedimentorum]MDK2564256.1 lantibiotic protection ABC transporter ATP-binding protein [Romboutsia sedimentorum]